MSYTVMDYSTGEKLNGEPEDALVRASLETYEGCVLAHLDGITWKLVDASDLRNFQGLGIVVRTVFIE